MVNPAPVTPVSLVEEYAAEIATLIAANAHEGPHDVNLHNPRFTPPQAGLRNCPRCRLILVVQRFAEMIASIDDIVVPPHLPKSNRERTLDRLAQVRDSEKVVGPVTPGPP